MNYSSDPQRCKECGGKCCLIYLSVHDGGARPSDTWFEEWVEEWDKVFEKTGASQITPLFDPLEVHFTGNEHLKEKLIAQGINPDKCKYCGKEGCIIPWELRPEVCKKYMCEDWIKNEH